MQISKVPILKNCNFVRSVTADELNIGPHVSTVAKNHYQTKEHLWKKSDCTNEIFEKRTCGEEVLLEGVLQRLIRLVLARVCAKAVPTPSAFASLMSHYTPSPHNL